jgi:hypothetical protein
MLHYIYRQYYPIQKTSKIIHFFSKIVDNLYWKPLEYIHDLIAPDLPYSGTCIAFIAEILEKGNQPLRYKLYRHSYLLFDYIPQLVVSFIFFIDIVILKQLYYFIYCMGFLLIPIIYKIYIKLCTSFVIRNEPDLLEILDIKPQSEPDKNGIYVEVFSIKSKYVSDQAILKETVTNYIMLRRITRHINVIKVQSARYYPYIILLTSSLYLSAAIYRLIYILF